MPETSVDPEFAACGTLDEAVRLLMHRLGICAERMVAVLGAAVGGEANRSKISFGEAGFMAWKRYSAYSKSAGSMRYSWGPRKFFAEGHWLNPGSWPVDSQRMRL